MKYTYSLGHRLVAHVLLWGFLLQSCCNPPAPLPRPHGEKQEISKEVPYRIRTKVTHQQEETLPSSQSIEDILSTPNTDTRKKQPSGHQPSIQPNHKKQPIQDGTNKKRRIEPKAPSLPLSVPKAIAAPISTKSPHWDNQIPLPPTNTEKQLQTPIELPTTKEESIQPGSPETSQSTAYYHVKGGYQVKFIQKGQAWIAHVQDNFTGFHGSFEVPVYIEMGTSIQDLAKHSPVWIKSHIHVCPPTKDKEGYVWVGGLGLQGGGGVMSTGGNNMGGNVVKEPIHKAVEDDNYRELVSLINKDRNVVNVLDANLNTPLHYAAYNTRTFYGPSYTYSNRGMSLHSENGDVDKKVQAIKYLISKGARTDAQDNQGNTPLHYAFFKLSVAIPIATALIEGGAQVNIKNNQGSTPLHILAMFNQQDLVQLLLQKGANVRISNNDGYTPLHLASKQDIVQLLLTYGADIEAKNNNGKTPLFDAVEHKNLEKIRLLIGKGAKKEARDDAGNTPLHQAIADFVKEAEKIKGYFDSKEESLQKALQEVVGVTKLLRELGVNPYIKNNQGKTPIHLALDLNDSVLAKQLLNALSVGTYKDQEGYSALHRIVLDKDTALLKQLADLGVNNKPKDNQGNTPLHLAVDRGDMYMVEQLIKLGADVHVSNDRGLYPVHLAIVRGNTAIVRKLITYTHINVTDIKQGNTPLHLAIEHNKLDLIRDFVQAGADLHYTNKLGLTPIDLASVNKHLEYAQQIFALSSSQLNTVGSDGLGHIHRAIKRKDSQLVKQLLSTHGIDINLKNKYGRAPLHMAVEQGDVDMMKLLVSAGAKKDSKDNNGKTPIHLALQNTNQVLAKQVLSALGVDMHAQDQEGCTLLHRAVFDNDIASFKQLVALGGNINVKDKHGDTPLHRAIRKHAVELVKQLIGLGSNVNAKGQDGETPSHVAACCGNEAIMRLLIEAGADIKATKDIGYEYTPLHRAVDCGNKAIIRLLRNSGASIEARDHAGYSPLHRAVYYGQEAIIELLIELGADKNTKDTKGNTLLHTSIKQGELGIVKQLVEKGADLHIKNDEGLTPIDLASVSGHLDCVSQIFSIQGIDIKTPSADGTTHMQRAAERGDLKLLQQLLSCGADKTVQDSAKNTLLHIAIYKGQLAIVKYLIEQTADLQVKNGNGLTPIDVASVSNHLDYIPQIFPTQHISPATMLPHLHQAIARGDVSLLKQLFSCGADKNIQDQAGNTLLHTAIQQGQLAIVKYLVEIDADLQAKNQAGLTPIDLASTSNHLDYVASIFAIKGVDINAVGVNGMTHLHHAVEWGDEKLVQQLIACQADAAVADDTGATPLHRAAMKGNTTLLQYLQVRLKSSKSWFNIFSKQGSPVDIPDKQGNTPLHLAMEQGHLAATQFLLQEKADLYAKNAAGLTPIHQALAAKQYGLLKALLSVPGCSPLHMAATHHDINLIKQLLAIGIDIDTVDSAGKTILYIAFEKKYSELTKQLIELGAKINGQDSQGRTMLHHAIANGDILVATALLVAKADIHIADKEGFTSLHVAAQYNQMAIAKQLINQGARVNVKDKQDRTPLHVAALHGHSTMTQLLIQEGADLQAVDKQALTPLVHALQQGHLTVVKLLAATSEYILHIQRCMAAAHRAITLPKESKKKANKSKLPEKQRQKLILERFIQEYTDTLPLVDQQKFNNDITPILRKKVNPDKVTLQRQAQIIQYFQEGGNLYPHILSEYDAQDWVVQSLLADMSQEAWANNNELLFSKFQECTLPLAQGYPTKQLEAVLLAMRERQQMQQLSLQNLCDIATYLSVLEPQQALDHLKLVDAAWLSSLRLAWLAKETRQLHPSFTLEQCSQLSYALAQTTWEFDIVATFITKLQAEKEFHQVEKLMGFLAKTQPDPAIVLMAVYQKPKQAEESIAQAWQRYIACELLKNKLVKLFPTHTDLLVKQAYNLLYQGVRYEEIDALLAYLEATNYQDTVPKAQRLFDVWDLLVEYGTTSTVCKEAFQVIQQQPSTAWEKEIHAQVVAGTFGQPHERSVEEIIDYIAAKSPQTPFANNKEALHKSYQAVLTAYQSTSKLFPVNKTHIAEWNKSDVTQWAQQVKGTTALQAMNQATQYEVLAVIRQAVKLHHNHFPRATQLLALLLYLNHIPGKGRLGQINTGEGKTLVVAMLAAVLGLQGKKVDVVTTSTELSIPAVRDESSLFGLLGLSVGENSDEETKKEVYTKEIVYGTAQHFQGDILKTEFLGEDIRGTRGFGTVIVDEVDSMLFDSRKASVRLSRYAPAMHHLEVLLGAVYNQVSRTLRHLFEKNGKTYYIHEDVDFKDGKIIFHNTPDQVTETSMIPIQDKEAFIKTMTRQYVEGLLRNPAGEEAQEWRAYKDHQEEIVKASIRLLCEEDEKQREAKAEDCERLAKQTETLDWVKNKRVHIIEIPNHLQEFTKKQIDNWIKSAIQAICFYKKELHYDVRDSKIVPIDCDNTGVLQSNMVWSNGLAQMLQIKEGLRVEPESISTNFISVPEFFRRYNHSIYGLTGTLGNETTQRFLADVYGVDQCILPPYQLLPIANNEHATYICKELPAIVVPTLQEWYEAICRTTLHKANNQRAVLVICKYIDQVKKVAQLLREQYDEKKILTYTGQEDFNKKRIEAGEIIVATNIAGRGTDITTSSEVEIHGGLHVCITFLPESYRVELQNAGRTYRQGKKGTAQLIIQASNNIEVLKAERNELEDNAINRAKNDIKDMLFRDQLFSRFCALEAEILPTVEHNTKVSQLKNLHTTFQKKRAKILLPGGLLDQIYEGEIRQAARKQIGESIQRLQQSDTEKIQSLRSTTTLEAIKQKLYNKHDKAATLQALEKKVRAELCYSAKGKYSNDVIERFREGYDYLFSTSELATKYDWGAYERLGVEERWGIWLQHAVEGKHVENEEAIWQDFEKFADDIRQHAKTDQLICNPYYYLIKGNDYLNQGKKDHAIDAYDRAIGLDGLHSVNAYYNKAKVLISLSKDNQDNFKRARYALTQAKIILANHLKQNIVTFNSLIAATGGAKPQLLEHLQHQLNILMQQESHIDAALKEINIAQERKWNLEITELKSLKEVVQEAKGDHEPAIKKAAQNGLHELFVIKAKQPYPWKSILALALLGVVQVATGVLLNCVGLNTVGMGMINEGISDLIACGTAAIKGTFDWGQWAMQKAISITSSIVSGGIDGIKKAWGELKNVKEGIKTLTISGLKEGVKTAGQKMAVDLCKGTVKMLATEFINTAIEETCVKEIMKWFEKEITASLEGHILNNDLITKALELDVKNNNNYWQQIFIKEGLDMLTKTDGKWVQFLKGVAGNVFRQGLSELVGGGKNAIVVQAWLQSGMMLKALAEILSMTDRFWEEFSVHIKTKYSQKVDQALQAQAKKVAQTSKDQAPVKNTEQQSKPSSIEQFTTAPDLEDEEISVMKLTSNTNGSSVVENTGSALVEHFQGTDSHSNQLVASFGSVLKSKVNNTINAEMVNPVTSGAINLGIDKVTEDLQNTVDNAVAEYNTKRQGEIAIDQQANRDPAEQAPIDFSQLPPELQAHIKRIQEDGRGNFDDFAMLSQLTGRTILVREKVKEVVNGKEVERDGSVTNIIGSKHKGEPIVITYDPSNGGHYDLPFDSKFKLPEGGGKNDCQYKAVYASLTPENKQQMGITSFEEFKQKHIDNLAKNAAGMTKVYKRTAVMKRFNSDNMMEGGGKSQKMGGVDKTGAYVRKRVNGRVKKIRRSTNNHIPQTASGSKKSSNINTQKSNSTQQSSSSKKPRKKVERHPDTPDYPIPRQFDPYAYANPFGKLPLVSMPDIPGPLMHLKAMQLINYQVQGPMVFNVLQQLRAAEKALEQAEEKRQVEETQRQAEAEARKKEEENAEKLKKEQERAKQKEKREKAAKRRDEIKQQGEEEKLRKQQAEKQQQDLEAREQEEAQEIEETNEDAVQEDKEYKKLAEELTSSEFTNQLAKEAQQAIQKVQETAQAQELAEGMASQIGQLLTQKQQLNATVSLTDVGPALQLVT